MSKVHLEVTMMKRIGELNSENARLKAEVERLTKAHSDALADFWGIHKGYFDIKAEVERLNTFTTRTIIPNEELQAQVERLTKTGDALAYRYAASLSDSYGNGTEEDAMDILNNPDREELVNWLAAKEGKPSV